LKVQKSKKIINKKKKEKEKSKKWAKLVANMTGLSGSKETENSTQPTIGRLETIEKTKYVRPIQTYR
jgi:hypothetical protein